MTTAVISPRAALHSSKSNDWYTPPAVLAAARRVLGTIDLDPASTASANTVVKARRFYTIEDDGLSQDWRADTLWLNPPYGKTGNTSNQAVWSQKLAEAYERGHVRTAMLLVNAATDTAWFQALGKRYPICLIAGRIRFWRPSGAADSPTHGNALFYFGGFSLAFGDVCDEIGIRAGNWSAL